MAARVDVVKTVVPGPYAATAFTGLAMTKTAADASNFNSFRPTGRDILVVYGGTAGGTYTIQSAPDPQGRSQDFTTLTIATLDIHTYLFNNLAGWLQSDGTIWLKASVATIFFGVLSYPG